MLRQELMQELIQFFLQANQTTFEISYQARDQEVTPIQYRILELVYFENGRSPGEVAHCLHLSPPNATREISKLVRSGYLRKTPPLDGDKRRIVLELDEAGQALMAVSAQKIQQEIQKRFGQLDEKHQRELLRSIKSITSILWPS